MSQGMPRHLPGVCQGWCLCRSVAVEVGFEPTEDLRLHTLSSTAHHRSPLAASVRDQRGQAAVVAGERPRTGVRPKLSPGPGAGRAADRRPAYLPTAPMTADVKSVDAEPGLGWALVASTRIRRKEDLPSVGCAPVPGPAISSSTIVSITTNLPGDSRSATGRGDLAGTKASALTIRTTQASGPTKASVPVRNVPA